tara:strand:+ start:95 stop:721 length:627 start_codon:yes stop_codon:yes gene_type:complete
MDNIMWEYYRHTHWKGDPLNYDEWAGVKIAEPVPGTSFIVGDLNDPEDIESLRNWKGYDRSVKHARQQGMPPFLARDEDLVEVLLADRAALDELGTTHYELASVFDQTVSVMMNAIVRNGNSGEPVYISTNDRELELSLIVGAGLPEYAPLPIATPSRVTIEVKVRGGDESFMLTEMAGDLAHLWGFFEGQKAQYRIDPAKACRIYRD